MQRLQPSQHADRPCQLTHPVWSKAIMREVQVRDIRVRLQLMCKLQQLLRKQTIFLFMCGSLLGRSLDSLCLASIFLH